MMRKRLVVRRACCKNEDLPLGSVGSELPAPGALLECLLVMLPVRVESTAEQPLARLQKVRMRETDEKKSAVARAVLWLKRHSTAAWLQNDCARGIWSFKKQVT